MNDLEKALAHIEKQDAIIAKHMAENVALGKEIEALKADNKFYQDTMANACVMLEQSVGIEDRNSKEKA